MWAAWPADPWPARPAQYLFSHLDLVFFDTTSIYFEGAGGVELGQYGHSKDHRPDCKQMVVGVVLDGEGRPLCRELWPGNVTDVKTLIPIADRLQQRFRIRSICIVADRGMISQETIAALQSEKRQVHFLLGARLRNFTPCSRKYRARYKPRGPLLGGALASFELSAAPSSGTVAVRISRYLPTYGRQSPAATSSPPNLFVLREDQFE